MRREGGGSPRRRLRNVRGAVGTPRPTRRGFAAIDAQAVRLSSSVSVGLLHRERVWQMADLAYGTIVEQDFNDVEADFHRRVSQAAEVIQGRLGKQPSFPAVHRGGRAGPSF